MSFHSRSVPEGKSELPVRVTYPTIPCRNTLKHLKFNKNRSIKTLYSQVSHKSVITQSRIQLAIEFNKYWVQKRAAEIYSRL
jgi:hypothetical protein